METFQLVTQLTFYVMTLLYVIFSVIFVFHWRAYAANADLTRKTFIIYFSTTIPLLLTMAVISFFFI